MSLPAPRANLYTIISRAVEEGARIGYRRAHKHTDAPGEDVVLEHVERAVMESLAEVIAFED